MSLETVVSLIVSALLLFYLVYALCDRRSSDDCSSEWSGWYKFLLFIAIIIAIAKPVGIFMTHVFNGERTFMHPVMRPLERLIYRLTRRR